MHHVQAGPAPESNITSAMWLYRSLVDQQAHADAGLFGPLIITRRADADPITAKPRDLDAEFVTVFQACNMCNCRLNAWSHRMAQTMYPTRARHADADAADPSAKLDVPNDR